MKAKGLTMTNEEKAVIVAAKHYAWNADDVDAHNDLIDAVDALEKAERARPGLGNGWERPWN